MFAVIKTGGKQYRVSPGDMLIVEKLDGAPGDEIRFDQVMMLGEGEQITVGAPLIDGGLVRAVLVETRKGEKIKVFKKKRRQGYRRTKGHRQIESVLRVTGLEGAGQSVNWEGQVDLTTRAEFLARSRGLPLPTTAALAAPLSGEQGFSQGMVDGVHAESAAIVTDADPRSPVHHVAVVEHAGPASEGTEAPAKKARAPRKAKAETLPSDQADASASQDGALIEPPTSEVAPEAPQTIETPVPGPGAQAGTDTDEQA
ncbi:MAG: 50S ribosomal protein L21 [Proteobacteria bacterium]|nr:50S ribosomal protein L21 [Pseudomonadota bacterium]MBW3616886.1 50S ribosomal protein L21 [Pseudomonadota bacterium]